MLGRGGTPPGRRSPYAFTERSLNHHVSPVCPTSLDLRYIPADHPHHVRSVSPPEAQGSTCLEEVPSSPQCGSTPAFQLKAILRHEFHNIRSVYTHRTILVGAHDGLRHMPDTIPPMPQAHSHCHLARYNPFLPPCQPLTYNPSPMHPPEV